VAFLENGPDTSLAFCTALLDTMHVCREKIGDGTLISSLWDLTGGTVNLFFYHDYTTTVRFNLAEELAKGDRIIALETLFPPNAEFEKLKQFKTPKDSMVMGVFIVACAGFFLLTAFYFAFQYLRRKEGKKYAFVQLALLPLGLMLFGYMVVLIGPVNVFYFPAPYRDPNNVLVSMSSYIPFLLPLLLLPFSVVNYRLFKAGGWTAAAVGLFTANNVLYAVLIGLFAYWRFYPGFL